MSKNNLEKQVANLQTQINTTRQNIKTMNNESNQLSTTLENLSQETANLQTKIANNMARQESINKEHSNLSQKKK